MALGPGRVSFISFFAHTPPRGAQLCELALPCLKLNRVGRGQKVLSSALALSVPISTLYNV